MPMILGYWDIRGLGHAARLLPEYTDSNDVERKYTMGDAPDYDRNQWLSEKSKLGLDFPNLPYSIDAAHELTQSNAILRKHDLQRDRVLDVRLYMARTCYSSDCEKLKPAYLKETPEKMRLFSDFLGKRPWFAGSKLTYKVSAYMKSTHLPPGPPFLKIAICGEKEKRFSNKCTRIPGA
uniref:Glutathione S-transferase n=1 Tax=Phocoena sinus TaxID=42100 RepID=A0A8C9B9E6_PHOSS